MPPKLSGYVKKVAIIENSKGLGDFFARLLDTKQYEMFPVWKTSQLPQQRFDAYIFTGDFNNISDGLLPIHREEIEFLKTIKNRRTFASCFFHQLFGEIFGGEVGKRETRFLGWHKMTIEKGHPILNGLHEPFFLNLNVDEIVKKPREAKILATNQDCTYQMLQYGENIVTCQSHPEILKQDALELIEEHREELMVRCPNLDRVVGHADRFADDESNELFLSNMKKWLFS